MRAAVPTHFGYAVSDIEAAAGWWARVHGAGPFFLLPATPYDEVTHRGAPARLEQRLAFGQWGDLAIELQQTSLAEPASLADGLVPRDGGINHVSYLTEDLDVEQERLRGLGVPELFSARSGPIRLGYHVAPEQGHAIEVLQRDELLVDFYAMVQGESRGWDGSRPLRDA